MAREFTRSRLEQDNRLRLLHVNTTLDAVNLKLLSFPKLKGFRVQLKWRTRAQAPALDTTIELLHILIDAEERKSSEQKNCKTRRQTRKVFVLIEFVHTIPVTTSGKNPFMHCGTFADS